MRYIQLTRVLHSTHEPALLPRGTIRTWEEASSNLKKLIFWKRASSKQTDILDQKVHVLQKLIEIWNHDIKYIFKNGIRDACSTADIINASLLLVYHILLLTGLEAIGEGVSKDLVLNSGPHPSLRFRTPKSDKLGSFAPFGLKAVAENLVTQTQTEFGFQAPF